jgi:hypothetical protein
LRYDDTRDREVNDLLDAVRDQQRQLDYLINTMQRDQQLEQGPPQQEQSPQHQQRFTPPTRGNQQQPRPNSANAVPERQMPATTLVFKDGHRVDVQNYVIAKNTLTVLDNGKREHIPLAQLDIPATQKANDEKGVQFKAPSVSVSLMCNPAGADFACKPHENQAEVITRQ